MHKYKKEEILYFLDTIVDNDYYVDSFEYLYSNELSRDNRDCYIQCSQNMTEEYNIPAYKIIIQDRDSKDYLNIDDFDYNLQKLKNIKHVLKRIESIFGKVKLHTSNRNVLFYIFESDEVKINDLDFLNFTNKIKCVIKRSTEQSKFELKDINIDTSDDRKITISSDILSSNQFNTIERHINKLKNQLCYNFQTNQYEHVINYKFTKIKTKNKIELNLT